ncbi:thermonuclease family protein [Staphylococcus massiliensis]|uniref:thermonuclease NucI n=1 Tax=Staphylococcus massiliensis TaxID=555791 RepID=UPI001EDEFE56|nr:thermonuclease family protein [Staphylococcus massiliensis]MCG3401232.1 thermonuclease family protein [Staphylococcus massiliensis]
MKSKKLSSGLILGAIIVIVLIFQFINQSGPFKSEQSHSDSDKQKVYVERVVDGDTIKVTTDDNERLTVRLIGVDTPETVKPNTPVQLYGKEASNYTKKALTHKHVYLEYDKEPHDKYDRTLAYVWMNDNDMYNEKIVAEGLARAKFYPPNDKYRDKLEQAQEEAKRNHLNLWK